MFFVFFIIFIFLFSLELARSRSGLLASLLGLSLWSSEFPSRRKILFAIHVQKAAVSTFETFLAFPWTMVEARRLLSLLGAGSVGF